MANAKKINRPVARQSVGNPATKVARPKGDHGKVAKAHEAPIKTGVIRARIDPKLKRQAEAVLGKLGLNASDAIRLFYTQIILIEGLPFSVMIPNPETIQAMRDADAGQVTRYGSAGEMFEKMGI